MSKSKWSNFEIYILKRAYTEVGVSLSKIAHILGRPEREVYAKAVELRTLGEIPAKLKYSVRRPLRHGKH